MILLLLLSIFLVPEISAQVLYPNVSGDWGYHTLATGGDVFYWYLKQTPKQYQTVNFLSVYATLLAPGGQRPVFGQNQLVIFLAGGPGYSSIGSLDIDQFGPYDENLRYRNTTILPFADLVFIEFPVGAGWSYGTVESDFETTLLQSGAKLVEFLTLHFFPSHNDLIGREVTIIADGDASQIAVYAAVLLQSSGNLLFNLRNIVLIGPDISPIDTYPGEIMFLQQIGSINSNQAYALSQKVLQLFQAASEGNNAAVIQLNEQFDMMLETFSGCVYPSNPFKPSPNFYCTRTPQGLQDQLSNVSISRVINGPVLNFFKANQYRASPGDNNTYQVPRIQWMSQADIVYQNLFPNRFGGVIPQLDLLLNLYDANVMIVAGAYDATATPTALMNALQRLTWTGLSSFNSAPVQQVVEGVNVTRQNYDQLYFFVLQNSGNEIGFDAPLDTYYLLTNILMAT